MKEKIIYIIERSLSTEGVSVYINNDTIKICLKSWDGYDKYEAFHSLDFIGFGYVTLDELIEKLNDYIS